MSQHTRFGFLLHRRLNEGSDKPAHMHSLARTFSAQTNRGQNLYVALLDPSAWPLMEALCICMGESFQDYS